MINERYWVYFYPILIRVSTSKLAPIKRLSESLNMQVIIKDKQSKIEKYYCQLVLLRPKLIIINIGLCNVTDHIPGPGIYFLISQVYEIFFCYVFDANFIELNHVLSIRNSMDMRGKKPNI